MIADIRSYLKTQIQTVNSDYVEIDDPIGDDDVSRLDVDSGFKIIFGDNDPFYTGNSYGETISVGVQLFKKAGLEVIESFDALYSTGIDVKNEIMCPTQVKSQSTFSDILATSMTIESIPTNDKVFRVTLNFTVRVDFTF